MNNETKLKTKVQFDGTTCRSLFEGHPDINLTGMMKIDSTPDAWSPPHLLIAAAESCIILTMLHAAERMRLEIKGYSSKAEGLLTSEDGTHMEVSEIIVRPKFELANEADRSRIPQLLKIAEEFCPVGRSLKTKVRIEM